MTEYNFKWGHAKLVPVLLYLITTLEEEMVVQLHAIFSSVPDGHKWSASVTLKLWKELPLPISPRLYIVY